MNALQLAAGAAALGLAFGAAAQKVYRCGTDGKTTYQQTPCAQGQVVDAGDPRTAEQRQAAQAVARSEAKSAAQFDRDLQPASAPKAGKSAKVAAAAPPRDAAASEPKGRKKADAEKPTVYLLPPKPGAPASGAKP